MAPADARLLIFAKAPVPGRVKTRLIPALGAEGAAELQRRLLLRTLESATAAGLPPARLYCAPDTSHPFFGECAERFGLTLHPQRGADLGERMADALGESLAEAAAAVLIGSDCPRLTADHLRQGFAALAAGAEVVLGPAEDGGYYLIGLRRPRPELFRQVPWGGERVLELTRARIGEAGLTCRELETLPDLDRPRDLISMPPLE